MKVVIIIPTYNEAGNIERLISEINASTRKLPYRVHLLVVDDNSPDGTGRHVQKLRDQYSNLHLITGKKKGLGSAYIRGISHAINFLSADVIMEMDADFSHKPADIPPLLHGLRDADFVIGSRYVNGGKIPDNWAYYRKLNSNLGNISARYIAGLSPIRDCTAGFRAIRSSIIEKIDLPSIKTKGYCFQIDLLHKAILNGAKVIEIPVEFVDRTEGTSKLGVKDIIEYLIFIWIIRLENYKTFAKFSIVGLVGLSISLSIFSILLKMGLNTYFVSAISLGCLVSSTYFLNKKWTFSNSNNRNHLKVKGLTFNRIVYPSFSVAYALFILLSLMWPGVQPHLFQGIGLTSSVLVSYFLISYANALY